MTTTTSIQPAQIQRLKANVNGRVIEPGGPEYDTARRVMYGGVDRHPAAVVRVADVDDVRAVIAFARDTGVELAIRSGGHSAKGDSSTEGGVVLDLRDLRAIDIDPDARTGWF